MLVRVISNSWVIVPTFTLYRFLFTVKPVKDSILGKFEVLDWSFLLAEGGNCTNVMNFCTNTICICIKVRIICTKPPDNCTNAQFGNKKTRQAKRPSGLSSAVIFSFPIVTLEPAKCLNGSPLLIGFGLYSTLEKQLVVPVHLSHEWPL